MVLQGVKGAQVHSTCFTYVMTEYLYLRHTIKSIALTKDSSSDYVLSVCDEVEGKRPLPTDDLAAVGKGGLFQNFMVRDQTILIKKRSKAQ